MPKPLSLNKQNPPVNEIVRDAYSLKIISPAYATSTGELNAVLQYVYHSFFFAQKGYEEIAQTLLSIAVAEMFHLETLGETILALGAAPVYSQFPGTCFNFYSTKYVSYSRTLREMLEDDILGERMAISGYEKMLKKLKSENIKTIISNILDDEKLHLETLEKLLADFKC